MHLSASTIENKLVTLISLVRAQLWYQKASDVILRVFDPLLGQTRAKQLIKYGMVGVLGTFIELGILNIFIFGLGWASDVEKILANLIAVSLAIVSNFTWNRLWTFPESRVGGKRNQFAKFVMVSTIGITLNSAIFYVADNFIFEPIFPAFIAVQLAKFMAIGIVLLWNFTANRFWTFRVDS